MHINMNILAFIFWFIFFQFIQSIGGLLGSTLVATSLFWIFARQLASRSQYDWQVLLGWCIAAELSSPFRIGILSLIGFAVAMFGIAVRDSLKFSDRTSRTALGLLLLLPALLFSTGMLGISSAWSYGLVHLLIVSGVVYSAQRRSHESILTHLNGFRS